MLIWDPPNERYYEHGLDRGVLYIPELDPITWNGLTGFEEGSSGQTSLLYRDGVVYLADADASDFSGKMSAMFFPSEFGRCIGIPEVTDGFFVDNQKPKRFGLSYRSLIGSGGLDDMFRYQIHLVYNCMASVGPRSRQTIGKDTSPVNFDFDIVATPVKLPGYRPTAHYIIDTRNMSPATVTELENILYGDGVTPGELPSPQVLFDLMNFGDTIQIIDHGNGYWSAIGSHDNVHMTDSVHFQINNVPAVDLGDGEYDVSGTDD